MLYLKDLSYPKNHILTYLCEKCKYLDVSRPLDPHVVRALCGGRYHFYLILGNLGYEAPPFKKG